MRPLQTREAIGLRPRALSRAQGWPRPGAQHHAWDGFTGHCLCPGRAGDLRAPCSQPRAQWGSRQAEQAGALPASCCVTPGRWWAVSEPPPSPVHHSPWWEMAPQRPRAGRDTRAGRAAGPALPPAADRGQERPASEAGAGGRQGHCAPPGWGASGPRTSPRPTSGLAWKADADRLGQQRSLRVTCLNPRCFGHTRLNKT